MAAIWQNTTESGAVEFVANFALLGVDHFASIKY